MDFKLRLKSIGILFLIYTLFVCINWYTNLKEVRLYEEIDKRELTKLEINKYIVKPNNKKVYYYVKQSDYVGKNSLIPFIVNKRLLKEHPAKIVQQDCGC
jgi:hypothetical protein